MLDPRSFLCQYPPYGQSLHTAHRAYRMLCIARRVLLIAPDARSPHAGPLIALSHAPAHFFRFFPPSDSSAHASLV